MKRTRFVTKWNNSVPVGGGGGYNCLGMQQQGKTRNTNKTLVGKSHRKDTWKTEDTGDEGFSPFFNHRRVLYFKLDQDHLLSYSFEFNILYHPITGCWPVSHIAVLGLNKLQTTNKQTRHAWQLRKGVLKIPSVSVTLKKHVTQLWHKGHIILKAQVQFSLLEQLKYRLLLCITLSLTLSCRVVIIINIHQENQLRYKDLTRSNTCHYHFACRSASSNPLRSI
jgi:hypothetical protein